jgi:hypothetical protein
MADHGKDDGRPGPLAHIVPPFPGANHLSGQKTGSSGVHNVNGQVFSNGAGKNLKTVGQGHKLGIGEILANSANCSVRERVWKLSPV